MQRALIASAAVLTVLVGFLAWSRFLHAPPPAATPREPPAGGHGAAAPDHGAATAPHAMEGSSPAVERARAPLRLPVLRKPDPAIATTPYLPAGEVPLLEAASPHPHPPPSRPPQATTPPARSTQSASPVAGARDGAAGAAETPLPGALAGTVRDGAGAPVPGVSVLAVSSSADDAYETTTDDGGGYRLAALKPGRYLLFTDLGRRMAGHVPARAVEVVQGGEGRLELREAPAGAAVRIRVLGPDGAPATAQAVLVEGLVPDPAALAGLLGTESVHLPDPTAPTQLRRVAAGVYSVVLFRGASTPPLVVARPLTVRGDGDQELVVRLPGDLKPSPQPTPTPTLNPDPTAAPTAPQATAPGAPKSPVP